MSCCKVACMCSMPLDYKRLISRGFFRLRPDFNTGMFSSQAFEGYNINHYTTDFEYAGIQTILPYGITLDDKIYTNGFYHHTLEGSDPNGDTPNVTGTVFLNGVKTTLVNAVPGETGIQDFRGYGNILRLSVPIPYGEFKTGLRYQHEINSYSQETVIASDN